MVFSQHYRHRQDTAHSTHLSCSVPQLEPYCSVLDVHSLAQEINADGSLVGIVKLIVHESKTVSAGTVCLGPASNLVMRLVFPTLWSPRRTTLVRLGEVKEKSAAAGVDGASIGGMQS